jgi:hypothetical protein
MKNGEFKDLKPGMLLKVGDWNQEVENFWVQEATTENEEDYWFTIPSPSYVLFINSDRGLVALYENKLIQVLYWEAEIVTEKDKQRLL